MKQFRFLARVLSRAVSKARVDSAKVVTSGSSYWILVNPNHYSYWKCFKEVYPHWEQAAQRYGVIPDSRGYCYCPEFTTLQGLLSWLFDVLELTRGERRLLRLMGVKGCQRS